MEPTTPRTRVRKTGMFHKQTILIVVGPEKVPFHVHFSRLETITFFDRHGPPHYQADTRSHSVTSETSGSTATLSSAPVKEEPGVAGDSEGDQIMDLGSLTSEPAYHLTGICYEPEAFDVIVNFLYNQQPDRIGSRQMGRTYLRAYCLAVKYEIPRLQDAIVDCFRKHHREADIVFEDLIWLVNRFGDNPANHEFSLIKYLVAQLAWELHTQGFESYSEGNVFFPIFLVEGTRPLREALFKAVLAINQSPKPTDPATGPNRWKAGSNGLVEEAGHFQNGADTGVIHIGDDF